MEDGAKTVPPVRREIFAAGYEIAERAVLRNPTLPLNLEERIRPTVRIARAIAHEMKPVDAEDLYGLSVRICALWRLLSGEHPQIERTGLRLTETGIAGAPARKAALLATAASMPMSDDLRFEPERFFQAFRDQPR